MASDLTPLIGLEDDEEKNPITGLIIQDEPTDEPLQRTQFSHNELAGVIRNRYPKYQDPGFSDEYVVSEAIRVMPELADMLEEAPSFGEQLSYSAQNVINTFTKGTPEVISDIVSILPDGPILNDDNMKQWAGAHLKELKEWQKNQRENDPRYAAWERWNAQNTGIDEWSDLVDSQLFARSMANWLSTGVTWVSAGLATATTRSPAAGMATATILGGLLEGGDEATSSIDYLTQDKQISFDQYQNDSKEFLSLLPDDFNKEERDAALQNFMQNYVFNADGTLTEKGLSVEEAQDINTGAVLSYAFIAGTLESLPALRIIRRVPGMEDAWRKYAHGSLLHKMMKNVRRKPYNPSVKGRFIDGSAWAKIAGDAGAEFITESSQYLSQVWTQSASPFGYTEESFGEMFDVSNLLESGYMGLTSGGAMGTSSHLLLDTSGLSARMSNFSARRNHAKGGKVFTEFDKASGTHKLYLKVGDKTDELTSEVLGEGYQAEFDSKSLALEAATTLDLELQQSFERQELANHYDKIDAAITVEKNDEGKFDVYYTKDGKLIGEKLTFDTLSEATKKKRVLTRETNALKELKNQVADEQGQEVIDNIEENTKTSAVNDKADEVDSDVVAIKSFLGQDLDETEYKVDEKHSQDETVTYDNPAFIEEILERRGEEVLDKIDGVTGEDLIEMINARVESEADMDSQFNEESQSNIINLINSWQASEAMDETSQAVDETTQQDISEEDINIDEPTEDVETKLNFNFNQTAPAVFETQIRENIKRLDEEIADASIAIENIPEDKIRNEDGSLTDEAKAATDKLNDLISQKEELEYSLDEAGLNEQEKAAETKDEGPTVKIETVKRYDVPMVKANPDKVYIFGDNIAGYGKKGQSIIRDEPNTIGVPTKISPNQFMRDIELGNNKSKIDDAFEKIDKAIAEGKTIVFPEDGLGTGLAQLKEKAPKTWEYLQKKLEKYDVTKQTKKQSKSTKQRITERKLKKVVRSLTNKIIFPDGSKIKIKLDDKIDSAGEYDPKTKTITLNPNKAGMDTPFHEISHPLIDELYVNDPMLFDNLYNEVVNSKQGKDVIKTVKSRGYEPGSDIFKMEVIAESIGRVAAGKYKSPKNSIVNAVNRFFKWMKEKLFGPFWMQRIASNELNPNTTIEQLADIITKEGTSIKLGDTPKNMNEYKEMLLMQIKYQLSANRALQTERNKLFNTAYNMFARMVKLKYGNQKVDGKIVKPDIVYFQQYMLGVFSEQGITDLEMPFNDWFLNKFEKSFIFKERTKDIVKTVDSKFYLVNGTEADTILNDLMMSSNITSAMSELSDEVLELGSGLDINNRVWMGAFKASLTPEQYAWLQDQGRKAPSFYEYQTSVLKNLKLGNTTDFNALTPTQQNLLVQEYVKAKSTIRTNRENGENQRDMYVLRLDMSEGFIKIHSFELKGPQDSDSGLSNNKWEKINMVESIGNWGIFSVLGQGDFKTKRTLYNPDGSRVNREDGTAVKGWKGRSTFLNEREIIELNKALYKKGLVLLGTRGEQSQMFFARITDQHRADAKKHKEYWNNEKKYVPKADRDRYIEKKSFDERVVDIAMHESLKAIWPQYHKEKLSKVFKRLKIPTTSALINREMPSYKVAKFNPKNASFVYENADGTVNIKKARQSNIPGIGLKEYIGDGATITSNRFFKNLTQYFGMQSDTAKAKTVVYDKQNDDVIMMKHEQFAVDPGVKIYYNYGKPGEKLVAELDENGDIIYYLNDKDGEKVDLLATGDEIKISNGKLDNNVVELEGKTLGLIKRASKVVPYAKHGMQPYNHIHEPSIVNAFNQHIAPEVRKKMRKIYKMSDKENYSSHMLSLLQYLQRNEDAGFQPTILELMKLGAGRHQSMEALVNSIVMKNMVEKAISIAENEGSYFDISLNFRADLQPKQVALGKQNSNMIYQKYADAHGMTLTDAKKLTIEEINEWLAKNEVYVYITRFPVPHKGGVLMARVMRLHDKKSVIEMHEYDVFIRLEADFDGDAVQVEMLPDEMIPVFREYLDNIDVKGINLNRYVTSKFEGSFSVMEDRILLMDALTQGQRAIGEIANIQSIYGMLLNTLEYVQVESETPSLLFLRKPNEKFRWNVPYKDRSGKVQPYRDITVEEYLRTILQAAVDNGEFLLLQNWNYSQMNFMAPLFKNEYGNTPSSKDIAKLMPLIDIHKIPGRLRLGQTRRQDGELVNLGLRELIEMSKVYSEYVNNREAYIRNLPQEGLQIIDIKFKDNNYVSPVETISLIPYETYNDYLAARENKYGIQLQDGSPFKVHNVVHANAHKAALERLSGPGWDKIFNSAYKKDNIESMSDIKNQMSIGASWANEMSRTWFALIKKVKNMSSTTMDRSENFLMFKEKWDAEYKNLSETAKMAATFQFLKLYSKGVYAGRAGFPPASSSKKEYQVLHEKVLQKYFKYYNEALDSSTDSSLIRSVKGYGTNETLNEIANRSCNVR